MSGKSVAPGRGRKPKPNAQKKLSGSKHVIDNPVEFDLITNVAPPEWLEPLARDMWLTVCPHLCKQKVLSVTDLHNLEVFCDAYATFREASRVLWKEGILIEGATGGQIKNPADTVKNTAARQLATFGAMLGLDPSARGRLLGGTPGGDSNPFDEF